MIEPATRQIRVFISSTFRDMQAERDYLVKFIFPQLRRLCEQRGVTWGEVDLRWGITDEQSAEGQVLPICLAEINRCRPYFIGLLGERYGWIPETIHPDLIAREPWLTEHLHHSVTELEILHGVLNNPAMTDRSFFYFRDPACVSSLDESLRSTFVETPSPAEISTYGQEAAQQGADERKRKLQELKDCIRASSLPLREGFHDPRELGEWVLADLTAVIDQLFPAGSQPSPLQQEAFFHLAFAHSRAGIYIGGEKYFQHLDQHLASSNLPLVVLGESGSGKSALLANWGMRYQAQHLDELVLLHFIGASPSSSNWAAMLRRIMAELKQRFELPEEIPNDPDELRDAFPNWLYKAGAKGKALLILDALNQLEDRQGAQELTWLPNELPENIRLVLSTLPGKALEAVNERHWPTLNVEPLDQAEREQLIKVYLAQYAKQLSSNRVQRISADPQSASPLGLRLLLDELRQFGSHADLDAVIDRYLTADSIPALFDLILQRCEADYESDRPGLVRDSMRYIWAARRGLSEAELLDLLGSDGNPLPYRVWAPLSLALEQSLVDRGGLLNFFHDFIRQAVEERYLPTDKEKKNAHPRLADYFAGVEGNPPRRLEELPWQLEQAGEWQRIYNLLSELGFFAAIFEHNRYELLMYWAAVEANTALKRTEAYREAGKGGLPLHLVNWLAVMYKDTGYLDEAMALHQEEERICRQLGNLDGLQASLGNQAVIHYAQGRLDEAMELHKEQERICRQLGNLDGLQRSLGNQALILKTWGRLAEAMELHKEEERICRQLGNVDGLCISLVNQGAIHGKYGNKETQIRLVEEALNLAQQHGLTALASQIEGILKRIKGG